MTNLNKVSIPWSIYSVVRDKQGKIQTAISPKQRIKSGDVKRWLAISIWVTKERFSGKARLSWGTNDKKIHNDEREERSNRKSQRRAQHGALRSDDAGDVWKRTRSSAWWGRAGNHRVVRGSWEGGEEPSHMAFVDSSTVSWSVWFYSSTVEIYHSTMERRHFSQKSQGSRTGFTSQNFKVSIHSLFLVPDDSRFWWTYNAFHKQVRGMWKAWNTGYLGRRRKVSCDKRTFHIVRSGEVMLACTGINLNFMLTKTACL